MSNLKEKRTKEQILKLLDRAMEQEEMLLEKAKSLELELAECQKKAANPRHEFEEKALPKSKVSFRLDYYRTVENGPLKGIIEHLPTRESRHFEGNDVAGIADFVAHFVGSPEQLPPRAAHTSRGKSSAVFPPDVRESPSEMGKTERSSLLKKLLPDIFGEQIPAVPKPTEPNAEPAPAASETEPFLVLVEESTAHQRCLSKEQAFQIKIPLTGLQEFQGKPCTLRLTVESFEKKPRCVYQSSQNCIPSEDALLVPNLALSLDPGTYRLVAVLNLQQEPQKFFYKESRCVIFQ